MIGILFGAGASFGSQIDNAPPLGAGLYASIKNMDIGPRREIKREAHECSSVVDYLSSTNTKITESITIDEWVASVSQSSKELFKKGDFEGGLSSLTKKIKEDRESRKVSKGASFMIPGDEQLDIALPEKIMRSVAVFMYRFLPSKENLYRRIIRALPENSYLFTLNYDSLLEIAASEDRVNLLEYEKVRKSYISHPSKSLNYFQLHGGVTLCSTWQHHREGVPSLVSHSNVERINRRIYISEHLWFDLDIKSYIENLKGLAALSFYDPEKSNVVAPDIFGEFHEAYKISLDKLSKLIIVGCRFTPHDKHLWDPVRLFKGEIYWCGSIPAEKPFLENFTHLGSRFGDSIDLILDVING